MRGKPQSINSMKSHSKKSKAILFLLLILFWISLICSCNILDSETIKKKREYAKEIFNNSNYVAALPLNEENRIEQTFFFSDSCDRIMLEVATYQRQSDSKVLFSVFDAQDTILFYEEQDASTWADNSWIDVFNMEGLPKDQQYKLVIEAKDGEKHYYPAVWLKQSDRYPGVVVNGENQDNVLSMKGILLSETNAVKYLCIIVFMMLASVLYILNVKKADEKAFAWFCVLFGLVNICVIAFPYAIDEASHYAKALSISYRRFAENAADDKIQLLLPANYKPSFDYTSILSTSETFSNRFEWFTMPYLANTIPINHFILAVPLLIARIMHISVIDNIVLCRAWNYLLYSILCWYAIKRAGKNKSLFFFVALLPLSQTMASVISTDPMIIAGALLFFAIIQNNAETSTLQPLSGRDRWMLLISFVLFSSVKFFGYILIAATLFLLPRDSFSHKDNKVGNYIYRGTAGATLLILIIWQVLLLKQYPYKEFRNGYTDITEQLQHIINSPFHFLDVLITYCTSVLPSLHFNTYNIALKDYAGVFCFIALGNSLLSARNQIGRPLQWNKKSNWLLIGVFFVISLINIVALYLAFTPVGASRIDGVQARYFIPQMILFLVGIIGFLPYSNKEYSTKPLIFSLLCMNLINYCSHLI